MKITFSLFWILLVPIFLIVGLALEPLQGLAQEIIKPSAETAFDCRSVDRSIPAKRRPQKMVLTPDEQHGLVANSLSGSVSIINIADGVIIDEIKISSQISDLIYWQSDRYLALDHSQAGRLLCFEWTAETGLVPVWQQSTVAYPKTICFDSGRQSCLVGGLWSRQIAKHSLNETSPSRGPVMVRSIEFAVGDLTRFSDNETFLVTDAYGNQWLSLNFRDLSVVSRGDVGTKRICGVQPWVARKPSETAQVVIVTQPLNRLAQAIRNDVHWGLMVANEIEIKDEASFIDPQWQESRRSTIPLGGPGEAKGDPESIAFSSKGEVAIPIGGVSQLALGDLMDRSFAYVPTGRRPVSCCFNQVGDQAYTTNYLDDSITIIDAEKYEVLATIPLGVGTDLTPEDRGERLFFDATVSHDSWMSCHSCHVEGHTSGFLNDNFSDQSFGAPKRVLSLLGHGDTAPFAWNGSAATLEDQVQSSIQVTMQTDDDFTNEQFSDLASFVRSLPAPPSLTKSRGLNKAAEIQAGAALFEDLGCQSCHQKPNYTSPELRQVGLEDELGGDVFNPPSLIGVSQRNRFFHDARYNRLRDVFTDNQHQLKRELEAVELDRLLFFLQSL